ncbi:hypothetical protein ABZP36_021076 [Zizania latifolia]
MRPAATRATTGKEKSRKKGGAGEQLLTDQVSSLRACLQDALALGLTKSDDCGSKKWQTTVAGIQSHALKAAAAFLGCLSTDMLRLPHIKVYPVFVCAESNCLGHTAPGNWSTTGASSASDTPLAGINQYQLLLLDPSLEPQSQAGYAAHAIDMVVCCHDWFKSSDQYLKRKMKLLWQTTVLRIRIER